MTIRTEQDAPVCTVVIPARNEVGSIASVVERVPEWLNAEIIVVDNGSDDQTAEAARRAGARVVYEPVAGYGQACRAGVDAASATQVVVFIDGDGSMDAAEIPRLIAPILDGSLDIVCGSRGQRAERGSLPAHQRFGNALAVLLLRLLYRVRLSDLGPYRAIEVSLLRELGIGGSRYAWVAELIARAARHGARISEVDVGYRQRNAGMSKVSGSLRGSIGAGVAIISTVLWTRVRRITPMAPATGEVGERTKIPQRKSVPTTTRTVRGFVGGAVAFGSLVPIALYLWVAVHRIGYHFELEWLEGGAVELVARAAHGHSLYTAPSLTNVPWPYPPLYFWVSGAVAKVVGIGFFAPRLVSLLASLGSMGLLARIVRNETGRWSGGLLAAGLFAAAYHQSGDWYDIARVDSLFVFLTLLTLMLARRATTVRMGALVGVIGFLAFFTKQSAAIALAFAFLFVLARRPWVGATAIGVSVGLVALSTVVMDVLTGGWYRYYVFDELPAQGISSLHSKQFWTVVLWREGHALVLVAIALLIVVVLAGWAGREGRIALGYWTASAAGLLITAWLAYAHSGGFLDVLMPAFAALALGGGLAFGWALNRPAHNSTFTDGSPFVRMAQGVLASACLAAVSFQLATWWYPASRQIPTVADARAGEALLATIEKIPGRVVVLDHPWYSDEIGDGASGQAEAIRDIIRAGPSKARTVLEANLANELPGVSALILDNSGDEIGITGVLARDFVQEPLDWHPGSAFHEVDDLGTRPHLLFVRRAVAQS